MFVAYRHISVTAVVSKLLELIVNSKYTSRCMKNAKIIVLSHGLMQIMFNFKTGLKGSGSLLYFFKSQSDDENGKRIKRYRYISTPDY